MRRYTYSCHASFDVIAIKADEVCLRDRDEGKSVTNDAEWVVEAVLADHPGKRIFYIDTMGACDELKHDGTRFTGFAPARGRYA